MSKTNYELFGCVMDNNVDGMLLRVKNDKLDFLELNIVNDRGETLLHTAAKNGFVKMASLLLGANANINAQDEMKNTPLHSAIQHAPEETVTDIVNELLRWGPNVDAKAMFGITPIVNAIDKEYKDVIKALMADKCDIYETKSERGETAIDYILRLRKVHALLAIIEHEKEALTAEFKLALKAAKESQEG